MNFSLLVNLIIVLCAVVIVVLFLRHIPEIVERRQNMAAADPEGESERASWRKGLARFLKNNISNSGKRVWSFVLEAKDIKQGQILASQFAKSQTFAKSQFAKIAEQAKKINLGLHGHIRRAQQLVALGKYDEAEQIYLNTIRKHPRELVTYENLAAMYMQQQNYDYVREIAEFMLKREPENDNYLALYGNVLMAQGEHLLAIEVYEKSFQANELIPSRYINAGLCYESVGNLPRAARHFNSALDLDPSNMAYLMMLVETLVKAGDTPEAKRKLERAAEIHPDSALIQEKIISLTLSSQTQE